MVKHYNTWGKNHAACGEIVHPLLLSTKITSDKAETTCKRCIKTFAASHSDEKEADFERLLERVRSSNR